MAYAIAYREGIGFMKKKKWLSLFEYPVYVVQVVILTIIYVVFIGASTVYFSYFTDSLVDSHLVSSVLWKGLVGYLLLQCLLTVTNYLYQISLTKIKSNVAIKIRSRIFDSLYHTVTPEILTAQTKDKISNILINDIKTIREKYIGSQISVIRIAFRFIVFLGILFYYSLVLGLLMSCVTILLFVFSMSSSQILQKWGLMNAQAREDYLKDYQEYINSRADYKYVEKDEELRAKMLTANGLLERVTFQFGNKQVCVATFNTVTRSVARCLVILLELVLAASGRLSVGSIIASLTIISLLEDEISALQTVIERFSETRGITEKIYQSFQSDVSVMMQKAPEQWEKFGLKDVSFGYTEEKILRNVNMVFERGKKYLLCGKSGCGKSTSLGLLLGINKNYSGAVFIDDRILPQGSESVQTLVAYLKQDFHLFHDSIENNICFGNTNFKNNLECSGFCTILNRYISNVSKIVENNGSNLSGGQRQVIGIARAIACGKQALILDESFSALDEKLYDEIMDYLKGKEDMTIIAISHRHQNLHGYDTVYMIEKGEVYEQQMQADC